MKIEKIRDSINHISEAVFEETTLKKILPNHLLIVVRGMILAHSFPVAVNTVDISINQDMKAIKPISDFDVEYLLNCLIALKRQILELITTAGHGTRKFDSNAMQKLFIPKPPKTLQQKFSDVANKVSIIKSQYQQSLNDLESLYGALSQKAFNGELDLSKVPLPDESEEISDDMSSVDQGNMTENNIENSILGFSQFDAASIKDIELRKTQLSKWFIEWLEHYQQESDLNINHFWQCIEFTTQDYLDENDEPLKIDVSDYDHIKDEVFTAIQSGVIKQTTNMIETVVDGKTQLAPGNQILLKKQH
jgi:type I restriction enzyme S subunit